uniref:Uncharacterized protein n=1 Tax=Vitrella brassicaformis TaxID=1169539 RepID=A0A7S1JWC4_9ALVE
MPCHGMPWHCTTTRHEARHQLDWRDTDSTTATRSLTHMNECHCRHEKKRAVKEYAVTWATIQIPWQTDETRTARQTDRQTGRQAGMSCVSTVSLRTSPPCETHIVKQVGRT